LRNVSSQTLASISTEAETSVGPAAGEVSRWLVGLESEIALLQDLESVAAESRTVSPKLEDGRFATLLEHQTNLCRKLEERRADRAELLRRSGHPSKDFLVVVLGVTPRDQHGEVVRLFGRYMRAAELAQKQIQLNRQYFQVSLAAVEDAIDSVVEAQGGGSGTYDLYGQKKGNSGPLTFSKVT
jgi:hypothetical protein